MKPKLATGRTTVALRNIAGELGGIAVDVNVYESHGFRTSVAPLSTIAAVRPMGLQVLVPEVWRNELLAHVHEWAEGKLRIRTHLAALRDWATPEEANAAQALLRLLNEHQARDLAERLIQEHETQCNAVQLKTAWAAIGPSVLNAYFQAAPPFEKSGPKKSEFPDAFAIETLEDWGKKQGKTVIVVSADKGCLAACDRLPHLVGFKSLTEALEALQSANETRRKAAENIAAHLKEVLADSGSRLHRDIAAKVESKVEELEPVIDFETDDYDESAVEVTVQDLHVVGVVEVGRWSDPDIRVIGMNAQSITFTWELEVEVRAEVEFSGVHTTQVLEASETECTDEVALTAVVVLTIDPLLVGSGIEHATVRSVELEEQQLRINFGSVELMSGEP